MTTTGKLMTVIMLGLFLAPAAGCGEGKPSCELLYKRLDKCDKMPLKKSSFMEICKEKQDEHKAEIACSAKSDCAEFKKCTEEARKAASRERGGKKVDEALAKGDLKKAMSMCEIYKEDLTDERKKKCDELGPKLYDELLKKARELVKTAEKNDYGLCYELKDAGKKLSPEKEKEAGILCKEIEVQADTAVALKEIDKAIKEGAESLPYQCSVNAMKSYDDLATDFAKQRKKDLLQACYVKLGKVLLEKHLVDMKDFCKFQVQEIYDAVKKFELKDAAIDALIEKAAPLCSKPLPQ